MSNWEKISLVTKTSLIQIILEPCFFTLLMLKFYNCENIFSSNYNLYLILFIQDNLHNKDNLLFFSQKLDTNLYSKPIAKCAFGKFLEFIYRSLKKKYKE